MSNTSWDIGAIEQGASGGTVPPIPPGKPATPTGFTYTPHPDGKTTLDWVNDPSATSSHLRLQDTANPDPEAFLIYEDNMPTPTWTGVLPAGTPLHSWVHGANAAGIGEAAVLNFTLETVPPIPVTTVPATLTVMIDGVAQPETITSLPDKPISVTYDIPRSNRKHTIQVRLQ